MLKLSILAVTLTTPLILADALSKLPVYTGEIMPTPQQITVGTRDMDVSRVLIKGETGSPQRRHLISRLEELGVKILTEPGAETATIMLSVGKNGSVVPPEKVEGYAVKMHGANVEIAGYDRLGLLWGISSLLQMSRAENGKILLRQFSGTDYPHYAFRGYGSWNVNQAWNRRYMLAFKFNALLTSHLSSFAPLPSDEKDGPADISEIRWLKKDPTPEWLSNVKAMSELSDLGIKWAVGFSFLGRKEVEFGSDETFKRMMLYFGPIAAAGGDALVMFDDVRFPVNDKDLKRFGSARETDLYFLNKLYHALKAKNPNSGIVFCPPFYWGPADDPSERYGESRDGYLRALGERLPKDVQICWSGTNVFAGKIKKEQVAWMTGLIKRKPVLWMNDTGTTHISNYHYHTEAVDVWQWHYDGLYDDVWFYPSTQPLWHSSYLLTEVDCLWNPAKYDKVQSPLRASAKLVGNENVVKLERLNRALSKFDDYQWVVNRGSVRRSNDIERDITELNRAWEDASRGRNGDMFDFWTGFGANVRRTSAFHEAIKEAVKKNTFANSDSDAMKTTAAMETGYGPAHDIILLPDEFTGGIAPLIYRYQQPDPRFCTGIRGKNANSNKMQAVFRLPNFTSAAYQLLICGQDDDLPETNCKVKITVNGNKIFEGENPLVPFKWGRWELPIKGMFLKEGDNTIAVEGISDGGMIEGGSFFLVNYMVLKKIKP